MAYPTEQNCIKLYLRASIRIILLLVKACRTKGKKKLALRLFMRTSSRKLCGTLSLLTPNLVVEPEPWNLRDRFPQLSYLWPILAGPGCTTHLDPWIHFYNSWRIFYLFQGILKSVILTKLRKVTSTFTCRKWLLDIIIALWVRKINVKKKVRQFFFTEVSKVWPRKLKKSLQISCFEF